MVTHPERPALDLSVYLVTDTVLCGERGVLATVEAALAGGVTVVQLRDALASDDDLIAVGRSLVLALAGSGVPLLVNDRVHLAGAIGAQGAHIGQSDMSIAAAREILGPDALLGLSVQTHDHVRQAIATSRLAGGLADDLQDGFGTAFGEGSAIDYLGVGPVWAQSTKPDAAAPGGPTLLTELVAASPWPCVAIGGIGLAQAATIRASGAAGMAIVSAICATDDPTQATRDFVAAWAQADIGMHA